MSTTIGTPVSRVDGIAKVTGQARYAAEFAPEGVAYAAIVESTVAAGEIKSIDTTAAEKASGVILVLTHKNADKLPYLQPAERPAVDPVSGEQLHVLQDASVIYCGQPIGLVIADTQEGADYAASLVKVTYTLAPNPLIRFDPLLSEPTSEAAAKKGRGPLTVQGDPDAALAAAAFRVDQTYVQPRQHHNAMEPHATVAFWEDDHLTLWSKTQWVQHEANAIALVFGIPPENVRVINPYIGGAFGSALRTWPHVTLATMAARRIKRPVRLELSRKQLFYSIGFRPQAEQHVVLGADATGKLTAIIHEAVGQTSTYEEFAEATLDVPAVTYACLNQRTSYRLVRMNTNTPCPMRGPGHATGLIAQEMAMDELAELLKMDPIELRLKNYAEWDPKKNLAWSSKKLRACYEAGAKRFGWAKRKPAPRSMRAGKKLMGMGMATAINPSPRYPTQASATLYANGNVVVLCATSDMGPGTYTSATQVAADTLGLPVTQVQFKLGDSLYPKAKEHGGSTTMASVGNAVRNACEALLAKINELSHSVSYPSSDYKALLQKANLNELKAEGSAEPGKETHSSYSFGAVFAEVHVDSDLGGIKVARIIGAYDAGKIINPRLAHSQCIGGMAGGVGMALLEEGIWDSRYGKIINASLGEYLVPVCSDIGELDAVFVSGEDTIMNPLSVKGLAELGLCGVAPAIANAVLHATGKRVRSLPITLDKILD